MAQFVPTKIKIKKATEKIESVIMGDSTKRISIDWKDYPSVLLPNTFWNLSRQWLGSPNEIGIFFVWSDDQAIYVGQGNIIEEVEKCVSDPRFREFRTKDLRIIWCKPKENYLSGIQRFLIEYYEPKIKEIVPEVEYIIPVPIPSLVTEI